MPRKSYTYVMCTAPPTNTTALTACSPHKQTPDTWRATSAMAAAHIPSSHHKLWHHRQGPKDMKIERTSLWCPKKQHSSMHCSSRTEALAPDALQENLNATSERLIRTLDELPECRAEHCFVAPGHSSEASGCSSELHMHPELCPTVGQVFLRTAGTCRCRV